MEEQAVVGTTCTHIHLLKGLIPRAASAKELRNESQIQSE
jgi:hypothetical protein